MARVRRQLRVALLPQRQNALTFDAAADTPHWSRKDTVSRVGSSEVMPDFASSWISDSIVSLRIDPVHGNDLWIHRMSDGSDTRLAVVQRVPRETVAGPMRVQFSAR